MRYVLLILLSLCSLPCHALYDCNEDGRRFQSSAPCDTGFMPFARSREYNRTDSMVLPLQAGQYRVSGSINDRPVAYVVDTGATFTTISARVAATVGVTGCNRRLSTTTANGVVQHCTAMATALQFGKFRLNNVEVSVLPGMGDEVLLGMNVLQRFSITQDSEGLRISN